MGFTIVETMIVLAVTGALFVVIAATLSGRQNEAEFIHAINDAKAQIQQVINQVSAGYYPDYNDIGCTVSGTTLNISSPSNVAQGTNKQCVFLGSVIQFAVGQTSPEPYRVYTVAGIRCNPQTANCTSSTGSPFQNVDPTVGDFSYSTGALEYGLTSLKFGSSTGAVGFLMEPGSLSTIPSVDGYNPGAQPVDLVTVNSGLGQTSSSDVSSINTSLQSPSLVTNPVSGWQICLVSGGTNQSGLITIGSSAGTLQVTLSVKGDKTCT